MKNPKKRWYLLGVLTIAGTILASACSKKEGNDPEPDIGNATASATVEFVDTNDVVQFRGTASGAVGSGSQDTVLMTFSGVEKPMKFVLMITPVAEGTSRMRENGFSTFGLFHADTTQSTNYFNAYIVGENNIDDNGLDADGEATFRISNFSQKRVKGTFELTMIRNTTIVTENGEVISGDIRTIKVTDGKFDVPLR